MLMLARPSIYRPDKGGGYKIIRLPNLIRRLLQPPLGDINPAIALVNVLLHIAHVVEVEAPFVLLRGRRDLVLRLEALAVHLGARAEVLLCVGEEVVRACSDQVRAADFGVCDGELGVARRASRAD